MSDVINHAYDKARGLGIDLLKLFLQIVIAAIIIPIFFHDKTLLIFQSNIWMIYLSWWFIFLAVMFGIIAYFLIFEGYYHSAHEENTQDTAKKFEYSKTANRFFDFAHYLGITSMICFIVAILFILVAIAKLIIP